MNLEKILQTLTSTKKGAVVIILIFVAVFVTNNLSFFKSISINFSNNNNETNQKSEEKESEKSDEEISENSLGISISDILYQNEFINSPSYLSFTLENGSYYSVGSLDKITIKVIHGDGLMYSVASPSDIAITNINNTVTEFTKLNFNRSGNIKVYMLLNTPTFERIEIQLFKKNTVKDIVFFYKNLKVNNNPVKDARWYNFTIFLLFVLGFIIIMIVFLGIYLITRKLS